MLDILSFLCFLCALIKADEEVLESVEIGTDGEVKPVHPNALSVIFENQSGQKVELYWDDSKSGVLQHTLGHSDQTTINTFLGHRFYYAPIDSNGSKAQALYTVTMEPHTGVVTLYDAKTMKERGAEFDRKKNLWMKEYYERTDRRWQNYYPRDPITWHYYDVNETGQTITATTDRTQFTICEEGDLSITDMIQLDEMEAEGQDPLPETCKEDPENEMCKIPPPAFQMENDRFYIGRMNGTTYCRPKIPEDGTNVTIEITNICAHRPRAFRIFNFLSDDEMEHIKVLGQFIGLKRSTVSEEATVTLDRTSQTVWLERSKSFIIDNIVRRVAHAIQMPHSALFLNASSESLQLVHYFGGELYKSHVDYGTDKPHTRYITFLMYLSDVAEGGNTSFPLADERCKDENGYFGVQPVKGSVMFFYNMFPDGNVDTKTQHYAEPPVDSQKWMTNLWIWDRVFAR
eukprot:322429_1